MRKPTFFVIGAPKCGTSALCYYLSQHRSVFFSVPKEPAFWCDEDPLLRRQTRVTTIDAYLQLFSGAGAAHLAVGEGSTAYLSSRSAVANIVQFNSDARFIIMLRNPVEMAPAWHRELLFNLDEDLDDFEEAWNLQESRRHGNDIPRGCRSARFLQYGEMGMYSSQVERCMATAAPGRVMIVLFDDFVAHTQDVYRQALRFLELPDDGRAEFPRVREAQVHRFRLLARLLLKPPAAVASPIAWIRRAAERNECSLPGLMSKLVRVKRPRKPLRPEFAEELRRYFQSDIERLALLIKRDLSHWLDQLGERELKNHELGTA